MSGDDDRIGEVRGDIHAYLAELEDIPGTRVLTAARSRDAGSEGIELVLRLIMRAPWTSDRTQATAILDISKDTGHGRTPTVFLRMSEPSVVRPDCRQSVDDGAGYP